jgi:hypothetical protein
LQLFQNPRKIYREKVEKSSEISGKKFKLLDEIWKIYDENSEE